MNKSLLVSFLLILSHSLFSQELDSVFQHLVIRKMQVVDSLNNLNSNNANSFSSFNNGPKITGTEQDCSGAINVCQQTYVQPNSYTGYGSVQEVYNTCLDRKSTRLNSSH